MSVQTKIDFNFDTLPFGTTLARQIAKQHLSNTNNVYWYYRRSAKFLKDSYPSLWMPNPGPGVHGCFTEQQWITASAEVGVWTRQHVLLSLASLLETYVKSAATASLLAMPELIDRCLDGVDSITYIKFPDRTPKHLKELIAEKTRSFTTGKWSDRIRYLSYVFGSLPKGFSESSSELQALQDKRNKIAHSYGAEGTLRKTPWEPITNVIVSDKHIEELMRMVFTVVKILDDDVFGKKIGGYEIFHEYAAWLRKQRNADAMRVVGILPSAFRDHIGSAFGRTPGAEYIIGLIRHYEGIN